MEDFKKELDSISAVASIEELGEDKLKATWEGKPNNHKNRLRELREEYNFEIIDNSDGPNGEWLITYRL